MRKNSHWLSVLFLLILFSSAGSCRKQFLTRHMEILPGTWKVEDKETYEEWTTGGKYILKGRSYKIADGREQVIETLSVSVRDNKVIYEATVPNQNEGRTIPFTLNPQVKDRLSFENPDHDFPKKVQYTVVTKDKLWVQVEGTEGKGFSFHLIRVQNQASDQK